MTRNNPIIQMKKDITEDERVLEFGANECG